MYGNIKEKIEGGESQHRALTDTTTDGKIIQHISIGPDSSTRVLMHGMNDGNKFGGEIVRVLSTVSELHISQNYWPF